MLLSFSIPTYNRDKFLLDNLSELSNQIRKNKACDIVEINVSNNGSSDQTSNFIKQFAANNKDIILNYRENPTNLGPDENFIQSMKMAKGKYSILLGDDDFLVTDGLKRILDMIQTNVDVDIFLSNRDDYTEDGHFIARRLFLRDDIDNKQFDFSKESDRGYYFYLCKNVGGCLTFISSVIYKTSIIEEYGEYNHSLDGTFYAFWYYWWQKLRDGGKLLYIKEPYIKCTVPYNNKNYGKGMARVLVEFNGFSKAASVIFSKEIDQRNFTEVLKASMIDKGLLWQIAMSSKDEIKRLRGSLECCYWKKSQIDELLSILSTEFLLSCLLLAKHPLLLALVTAVTNPRRLYNYLKRRFH